MRVCARGLHLVVAVDKVAASGGYLMACIADRVLAAPFAVVGSIGVIAEIPNIYRLLDRSGIEFEQITGGEFKRTVTPFTRTTQANRDKLTSQIEDTHALFKDFVTRHRPQLDIDRRGHGRVLVRNPRRRAWPGRRADHQPRLPAGPLEGRRSVLRQWAAGRTPRASSRPSYGR